MRRRGRFVGEGDPQPASQENLAPKLEIKVIFTGWVATGWALRRAAQCAQELDAKIALVYWQIVPRSFDFEKPPIPTSFIERQLCAFAADCCPGLPVEIRVYLCRHLDRCVSAIIRRGSVVLVAGRRRWWRSAEQKLASWLEASGYQVLFVDCGRESRAVAAGPVNTETR